MRGGEEEAEVVIAVVVVAAGCPLWCKCNFINLTSFQ
jgi:hypothetical protein